MIESKKLPKLSELRKLFRYDPKTGYLFYWKRPKGSNVDPSYPAGYVNKKGYRRIQINREKYSAHRLVMKFNGIIIPEGLQVDHINGNRDDNRIENIRIVTGSENKKNSKKYNNNSSGYTGVAYHKKAQKWVAYIKSEGKLIHLGSFENKNDAAQVRKNAELEFGFSKRHGCC